MRTQKHDIALAAVGGLLVSDDDMSIFSEDEKMRLDAIAFSDPDMHGFSIPIKDPAKYGMYEIFNPAISDQMGLIQFYSGVSFFTCEPEMDSGCVQFDLRLPLKPQLKEAAEHLQDMQDLLLDPYEEGKGLKAGRRHPAKWVTYLRVIDGRDAGASWRQIFDVVLKEQKAGNKNPEQEARGVWERARELMFNWRG